MKKEIYSGYDSGFYCHGSFEKFMKEKKAKYNGGTFKKDRINNDWEYNKVKINYFNKGFGDEAKATIILESEDEKKLSEIERLILNEGDKYPSK